MLKNGGFGGGVGGWGVAGGGEGGRKGGCGSSEQCNIYINYFNKIK